MLFLTENDFVDVVKEQQFKDVVTVSASSALTLARFRRYSEGKIIVNPENMAFPFMVHVSTSDAAHLIKSSRVYAADKVDNISPEPVAYCYRGFERETENPTWGYCWPNEVDDIYYSLDDLEDVSFYPLFEIPKELQND
jgi:hypothetical protein